MTSAELRAVRAGLGLTQVRMAEALGVCTRHYKRWETGTTPPHWVPRLLKFDPIFRKGQPGKG